MRLLIVMGLMVSAGFFLLLSGFVLPTWMSVYILILAIMTDSLTTGKCLKYGAKEANPIIRFFFNRIGFRATTILWWIVWGAIIYFHVLNAQPQVQTTMAIIYWIVPLNNLQVLVKSRNRYLKKQREQNAVLEQPVEQSVSMETNNKEINNKEANTVKVKAYSGLKRDIVILVALFIMWLLLRGI